MKCVCVWQIRKDFFKIKNKKVGKDLLAFGWHWLSARIERVDIVDNITTFPKIFWTKVSYFNKRAVFYYKIPVLCRNLISLSKTILILC